MSRKMRDNRDNYRHYTNLNKNYLNPVNSNILPRMLQNTPIIHPINFLPAIPFYLKIFKIYKSFLKETNFLKRYTRRKK